MEHRSLADCLMTLRGAQGTKAAMFELSIDGPIARLTMDRAGSRNALRVDDWRVLVALIEQADRMKARALILSSTVPGTFCAGADIGELASLHADPISRVPFRNAMRAALDAIRASPLPVIAVVDGDCFGAGVALAIACDIRVAGARARFATTPAKLGIGYPLEDIARLRALVGEGQAARMLLTAATLDAGEAVRIGLAEIDCASAAVEAERIAQAIAGNAPAAVAMLKHGLGLAAAGRSSDERHDRAFDAAFGSADFSEGFAAFREKRRADFDT